LTTTQLCGSTTVTIAAWRRRLDGSDHGDDAGVGFDLGGLAQIVDEDEKRRRNNPDDATRTS
jgi:hypothetical protein